MGRRWIWIDGAFRSCAHKQVVAWLLRPEAPLTAAAPATAPAEEEKKAGAAAAAMKEEQGEGEEEQGGGGGMGLEDEECLNAQDDEGASALHHVSVGRGGDTCVPTFILIVSPPAYLPPLPLFAPLEHTKPSKTANPDSPTFLPPPFHYTQTPTNRRAAGSTWT